MSRDRSIPFFPHESFFLKQVPSALSTLNLRIDLLRFFWLAKRGDRRKLGRVFEIERKAGLEKVGEAIRKFNVDRALVKDCNFCL